MLTPRRTASLAFVPRLESDSDFHKAESRSTPQTIRVGIRIYSGIIFAIPNMPNNTVAAREIADKTVEPSSPFGVSGGDGNQIFCSTTQETTIIVTSI
jgi:hypothetical protein